MIILFELKLIFKQPPKLVALVVELLVPEVDDWTIGIVAQMTTVGEVSPVIELLASMVKVIVSIIGPLAFVAKTMSSITRMTVQVTKLQCGKFKYNAIMVKFFNLMILI